MSMIFTDASSAAYTDDFEADRRRGYRMPLMISALVRPESCPEPSLAVRLYERSVGGLSFTSSVPFRNGERMQIGYTAAEGTLSVRAEVIHCESISADTFRVGVRLMGLDG